MQPRTNPPKFRGETEGTSDPSLKICASPGKLVGASGGTSSGTTTKKQAAGTTTKKQVAGTTTKKQVAGEQTTKKTAKTDRGLNFTRNERLRCSRERSVQSLLIPTPASDQPPTVINTAPSTS